MNIVIAYLLIALLAGNGHADLLDDLDSCTNHAVMLECSVGDYTVIHSHRDHDTWLYSPDSAELAAAGLDDDGNLLVTSDVITLYEDGSFRTTINGHTETGCVPTLDCDS